MLLAIDTATRYASVALYGDDGVLAEHTWRSRNRHSVELAPAIAALLAQQNLTPEDLTGLAVTSGPGSFTGLRIGLSVAKGLALGLGISIVSIPTLDVLAYAAGDLERPVIAVLEAGRGRLCVATYLYDRGRPAAQREPEIVRADAWAPPAASRAVVTGELSPTVVRRLLSLPGAELLTVLSPAASLRRAAYLAEMARDRIEQGIRDDLDSLSPSYARYPASGTEG